jgi:hypothetical protein
MTAPRTSPGRPDGGPEGNTVPAGLTAGRLDLADDGRLREGDPEGTPNCERNLSWVR